MQDAGQESVESNHRRAADACNGIAWAMIVIVVVIASFKMMLELVNLKIRQNTLLILKTHFTFPKKDQLISL